MAFRLTFFCALVFGFVGRAHSAETTNQVLLDTNETLFTVLAGINTCGYDAELNSSSPLRSQIRSEIAANIQASDDAKTAADAMCQFYQQHQQPDGSRNLAQYVSLALYLNMPPEFAPKVKEADLAPDAATVIGIAPLLRSFYIKAGIHPIWEKHRAAYLALTKGYHEAVAKMLFNTEVYLKLPSAGYLGRSYTVYLEPLGASGQTNARHYGADYFVVISPGASSVLKIDQIRHTYLHYLLDPFALKYTELVNRLNPLLDSVKTAPMDESFKTDSSLLITECLIRAIEARTLGSSKAPDAEKMQSVEQSMQQGFILTAYFYDALVQFEKDPVGLRNTYGHMLLDVNLKKEQRRASEVQFATSADPELLHLSRPTQGKLLITAEQRLAAGDSANAQKLAQQALDEKNEDAGRALFILAEVATANKDIQGARGYFQKALAVAQEPKVLAWSHIYLGRIFDLQEDRESAVQEYRAALTAGDSLPEAKAAAERGLQQPYEPPSHQE